MASFLVDPSGGRAADEPSDDMVRVMWLLFALLRNEEVDETAYVRAFASSQRTFKRDLRKLRTIGERHGFVLSPIKRGIVRLEKHDARLGPRLTESRQLVDLIRALAVAFGDPILRPLSASLGDAPKVPPFLRVSTPVLVEASEVGRIFAELQNARASFARISFDYLGRGEARTHREVEPYHVNWHAGRYYLIAYDVTLRKGWRQFALDRILGPLARSGTFSPRSVPAEYLRDDAVGIFKSGRLVDVTIELAPAIAPAVTCRLWQKAQHVELSADGSARVRFSVGDPEEAIRWAMSFGQHARIVGPPDVVRRAERMAAEIYQQYHSKAASRSSVRSA